MALHIDNERRRVAISLALGVLLLATAAFVGTSDWTGTYSHTASVDERYVDSDEPLPGERVEFESLSSEEREVFVEAVESNDAVWTTDPIGDRFAYPKGTAGAEWYFVEYEGETYQFATKDEDRFTAFLSLTTAVGAGLSGLALVVTGLVRVAGTRHATAARLSNAAENTVPLSAAVLLCLTLVVLAFFRLDGLSFLLGTGPSVRWASTVLAYSTGVGVVTLASAGVLRFVNVSWGEFVGTLLAVTLSSPFLYLWVGESALASGASVLVTLVGVFFGAAVVAPGFVLGWRLHGVEIGS